MSTFHGQSLRNAENKLTGWVDVPLSEGGRAEATIASCKLRDYRIDVCYASMLFRAMETAVICLTEGDDICGGKTSRANSGRFGIVAWFEKDLHLV